jgi:hypothetical protein
MITDQLLALSVGAFLLSTLPCRAGPCSDEIDRMQMLFDAKVEAIARNAPAAPESPEARLHRQPTPGSIATAESQLGALPSQTVETIAAAMARARKADLANDRSACEQALADVQRELGP